MQSILEKERLALLRAALAKKGNTTVVWDDQALLSFKADEVLKFINEAYGPEQVQAAYERGLQEGAATSQHEVLVRPPSNVLTLPSEPLPEMLLAGARALAASPGVELTALRGPGVSDEDTENAVRAALLAVYAAMTEAYPYDHPLMLRFASREKV